MNNNHALLCAVDDSNKPLNKLVNAARKVRASNAKLTSVGESRCIVALVMPDRIQDMVKAIKQAGGEAFITKMIMEGVKIEE